MPNNLAAQVKSRQRLVRELLDFVEEITRTQGRVLRQEIFSAHTTIERKLDDFAGFSFYFGCGFSMFGGGRMMISYQPRGAERPEQVLCVSWTTDIEKFNVGLFNPDPKWRRAIRRLMRRKDDIIAARDARERALEKRLKESRDRQSRVSARIKDAQRLGIM